ncbi:hypothetical protein LINPERHAP2_LOCUS30028, partial [Linum perenne]
FFPICDDRHYSLFVVNRRDKQYEFLDSKYPKDLEMKWRQTADRVVQYATSYFRNLCGESDFGDYRWVVHEGVRQKQGSNECGIFLLNWAEVWEGKVEDYMLREWKDKDYCRNRRDAICLALLKSKDNEMFSEVTEAASKWNHGME